MRIAFQENLIDLEQDLYSMAELVTDSVTRSVKALKEQNVEEAKRIKKGDKHINKKRWLIEEKCITLIATQQPVATDLRELITVLSIITDLERMGDYAAGIAKIAVKIGDMEPVKPLIDLPRMADIAVDMISKSLTAYAERDEKSARQISDRDDEVDELYHQIFRELVAIMIEDPKTITRCTYLLWAAHNLERIGDRVTNICERIIYLATGKLVENI